MSTEADASHATKHRRWRLRYSLRGLMIFTALLCLLLAWVGKIYVRVHHQRSMVEMITAQGGQVSYDYQYKGRDPPGPKILRWLFGDDLFAYVEGVLMSESSRTTDEGLEVLREFPRIKHVLVPGLTDDDLTFLADLPPLWDVSLLNTSITAEGLARLGETHDLRRLTLDGNAVDDNVLTSLEKFPQLEFLQLIRTSVTSAGLAHVSELQSLQVLSIYMSAGIGDEGMAHLAHLTNLEGLSLYQTSVSDEGLQHLTGLTNLTRLDLTHTAVGDGGLEQISLLKNLAQLKLGSTKITNAGLVHLPGMSKLQTLTIYYTEVTDAGLEHLKSLHTLRHLEIGPHVSREVADRLHEALPECTIQSWSVGGGDDFTIRP